MLRRDDPTLQAYSKQLPYPELQCCLEKHQQYRWPQVHSLKGFEPPWYKAKLSTPCHCLSAGVPNTVLRGPSF